MQYHQPRTRPPFSPLPAALRRAYFADDSASGFGLTNVRCMDDLTIGHEIGHVRTTRVTVMRLSPSLSGGPHRWIFLHVTQKPVLRRKRDALRNNQSHRLRTRRALFL